MLKKIFFLKSMASNETGDRHGDKSPSDKQICHHYNLQTGAKNKDCIKTVLND